MEQIVNSFNLFVDSSRGHSSGSKGDDYTINLQDAGIHAGEGEIIRMTLDNFSMPKVFTNINKNNNKIELRSTEFTDVDFRLTEQNVNSVHQLANDFATQFAAALDAAYATCGTVTYTSGSALPAPDSKATDNIIEFTVTTANAHGLTANNTILQMKLDDGDSYQLLGGDRITDATDTTTSSVSLTVPNASSIKVTCRYPALTMTTPYVYLRVPGVPNSNLETKGLHDPKEDHKTDTIHSQILGRVLVGDAWLQYTASTGREFFLDFNQKQLNYLRLKLTDNCNRPLGRPSGSGSLTAGGLGTKQSTEGNLFFSACLRFDIIKKKNVNHLETEHYTPNISARYSNVLTKFDNGKDGFGKAPGF